MRWNARLVCVSSRAGPLPQLLHVAGHARDGVEVRFENALEVAPVTAAREPRKALLEGGDPPVLEEEGDEGEGEEQGQQHDRQAKDRRDERVEVDGPEPP